MRYFWRAQLALTCSLIIYSHISIQNAIQNEDVRAFETMRSGYEKGRPQIPLDWDQRSAPATAFQLHAELLAAPTWSSRPDCTEPPLAFQFPTQKARKRIAFGFHCSFGFPLPFFEGNRARVSYRFPRVQYAARLSAQVCCVSFAKSRSSARKALSSW